MMKIAFVSLVMISAALIAGCAGDGGPKPLHSTVLAHLPEPVSNNAVALVGDTVWSFAGLHAGKTWRDVTATATACDLGKGACRAIAPLPDGLGRLAASAVALSGKIYIFGGYSVAEDGTEISTPEVWIFDPAAKTYARAADLPVPVDDAVVLGFAGRYAVVISGWHDSDNVDAVQVLDTQDNRWFNATAFPGAPVFGHAGAITGNRLLVCGGVKVVPPVAPATRRSFVLADTCWQGRISEDADEIRWAKLDDHPPGAAYRRAASSLPNGDLAFYGGTLNPYNYDGIGYDGEASTPLGRVDVAHFEKDGTVVWRQSPAPAGMDYRGAVLWHGQMITLGGMGAGQKVVNVVRAIRVSLRR